MNEAALNPNLLVPAGRALLMATFAITLVQSMRGKGDLSLAFERLAVAFVALTFFKDGAMYLGIVSDDLASMVSSLSAKDDLRTLLVDAYQRAASAPSASGASTSFNIPALLEQAWRTGVWGVMTAVVEGFFLITSFVLECAHDVLWQLVLFLFPLACGAYPVFPRILGNLAMHAVELGLWMPMLLLVEAVTGGVAREHMMKDGSLGLYVIAIQIIAIGLIVTIPAFTHRFMSGAFSGDFNSQTGVFVWVQRAVGAAKGAVGGMG